MAAGTHILHLAVGRALGGALPVVWKLLPYLIFCQFQSREGGTQQQLISYNWIESTLSYVKGLGRSTGVFASQHD